jgi:hypothetical protein
MLEVLLSLRRDITNPSFSLEFDDELPGCLHPVTIGQSAVVEEGILDKPQLHRFLQAGRKAILMVPLVAGHPIRASRFRAWRMPRPVRRILSPFLRRRVVSVTKSPSTASAYFFGMSWQSDKAAATCLSVMVTCAAAFAGVTFCRGSFGRGDWHGFPRWVGLGMTSLAALSEWARSTIRCRGRPEIQRATGQLCG